MKNLRIDIVGHVLASIGLGNAIANVFLGSGSLIPGEYYTPATVVSVAWFLLAWVRPRNVIT